MVQRRSIRPSVPTKAARQSAEQQPRRRVHFTPPPSTPHSESTPDAADPLSPTQETRTTMPGFESDQYAFKGQLPQLSLMACRHPNWSLERRTFNSRLQTCSRRHPWAMERHWSRRLCCRLWCSSDTLQLTCNSWWQNCRPACGTMLPTKNGGSRNHVSWRACKIQFPPSRKQIGNIHTTVPSTSITRTVFSTWRATSPRKPSWILEPPKLCSARRSLQPWKSTPST